MDDGEQDLEELEIRNLNTGEVRRVSVGSGRRRSLSEVFAGSTDDIFDGFGIESQSVVAGLAGGTPWRKWWREKRKQVQQLWHSASSHDLAALKQEIAAAKEGMHLEAHSPCDGWTALHFAAGAGNTDGLQALLDADADVSARTSAGLTALHLASRRGHVKCVQELMARGADCLSQDSTGSLALHHALSGAGAEVATALLEGGRSQLEVRCSFGQRPLERCRNIETVRQLQGSSRCQDQYALRTALQGVLLANSRGDAVRRLLRLTDQLSEPFEELVLEPLLSHFRKVPVRSRAPGLRQSLMGVSGQSPKVLEAEPSSFNFVKLLGAGAFGAVYHVSDKRSGQDYAMKIMEKSKVMKGTVSRYIMTERNVLSYIRHPYIVALHYAFQTSQHLVLVLQFCHGGNLQQLIEVTGGGLQEQLARHYSSQVLLALEHLHQRQVVYRDLKPENVVIDSQGHALLTDFGLSKEGVAGRTAQSFCGSLAYIAPEMLLRRGHGHTVDLYGLGVLLFVMLTGRPPYYTPEKEKLLTNIKSSRLKVPSSVSENAASLIKALLDRDPSKRLGAAATCDVRSHVFFFSMDWAALSRREVPSPLEPAPKKRVSRRASLLKLATPMRFRIQDQGPRPLHPWESSPSSSSDFNVVSGWDFASPFPRVARAAPAQLCTAGQRPVLSCQQVIG